MLTASPWFCRGCQTCMDTQADLTFALPVPTLFCEEQRTKTGALCFALRRRTIDDRHGFRSCCFKEFSGFRIHEISVYMFA
jgi:hypothetical protein